MVESSSLEILQTCLGAALPNLRFGSVMTREVTEVGLKVFSLNYSVIPLLKVFLEANMSLEDLLGPE